MSKIFVLNDNWQFADAAEGVFRPITVPGDVNAALCELGILPDPHIGMQFREYYPNSARSWVYIREFDKPQFDDNAELIFEGITGAATVYLNGQKLGEARNAHYPHRFDVTTGLIEGKNQLKVIFEPIEKSIGAARRDAFGWGNERTFLRTPPFNYGWDWSVAVPSTGLSGKVYLECDNCLKLVNVNYRTPRLGRVDFFIESSRAAREKTYNIRLRVYGHGADVSKELSCNLDVPRWAIEEGSIFSQHRVFTTLNIPDARYWFCNGMGQAALYDYTVELIVDGEVADTFTGKLGFRNVRIVEEPFREESGPGFSYEIELNGERVFVKGSNWIPVTLWPATATEEQYRRLLELARDANFNMLRVWGGGVYERDIFYDLCDEYGIMVWQDFMFASNAYPAGMLREEIKIEAEYQLKRLRLHPCITHWCGINEDVFSWAYPGCGRLAGMVQADLGDYSGSGNWQFHDDPELFSMILRGLTSQLGNNVPYIESSPHSHGDCGNLPQSGNCHFTSTGMVKNYPEKFRDHFLQVCSFNSEFGQQGPDCAYNTKRFLDLGENPAWPPENEELWVAHLQRGHGSALWSQQVAIAEKIIGPVNSFDDYIRNSQTAHFELTRCEYEYYRANRPDCGGTMAWMFNDCWPTGNWSQVNYYGQPKPVYYAAKRACAPLLPLALIRGGKAEFYFDNQTLDDLPLKGVYGLKKLDGSTVWSKSFELTAAANQLTLIDTACLTDDRLENGDFYFTAVDGFDISRCFAALWRHIRWPEAQGTLEQLEPGKVLVRCTQGYMRMAHLALTEPGKWADFSDNYFDLAAGESRTILTDAPANELKLLHWRTEWE
ncbi:MAG: hypothetical protein E7047_03435 [Lentisphaerae bacterium]|nr:hypothetical protein [Lentisphaerota bacterium]